LVAPLKQRRCSADVAARGGRGGAATAGAACDAREPKHAAQQSHFEEGRCERVEPLLPRRVPDLQLDLVLKLKRTCSKNT
jgi:hypothetical protein